MKGVRYLWRGAHDDQRLSWFGHFLICGCGSFLPAMGAAVFGAGGFHTGAVWFIFASVLLVVFFLREIGDERHWRDLGLWDAVDVDTSIQGRERRGVTRRYDKVGDLTGPFFNWTCSWFGWILLFVVGG